MLYRITEADTESPCAIAAIHRLNRMQPDVFPELEDRHFDGYWWFAYFEGEVVAFAGIVEMSPFANIGYFKRAYVMPDHRGHGLQSRFMSLREAKARDLGWTHLVSECAKNNRASAANFARAGFTRCNPEQKWGAPDSVYWLKSLI
jgi:RimJ/RimL family protein N-acetyltransferase